MEAVSDTIKGVGDMVKTIWDGFMEVAPKVLSFILWVLAAIIILPCVFVAGNIYPLWQEWGEEL
jgi:hypothetical protein